VSAEDKGTGSNRSITISNERGRLSKAEIERMIREAEEFKDADALAAATVEAKSDLETYARQMRSQVLKNEQLRRAFPDDIAPLEEAVEDAVAWLDRNQAADKDEFEDKLSELKEICEPFIKKVQAAQGGAGPAVGGRRGGMEDVDEEEDYGEGGGGPPPMKKASQAPQYEDEEDDDSDGGPPPLRDMPIPPPSRKADVEYEEEDDDDDGPPPLREMPVPEMKGMGLGGAPPPRAAPPRSGPPPMKKADGTPASDTESDDEDYEQVPGGPPPMRKATAADLA